MKSILPMWTKKYGALLFMLLLMTALLWPARVSLACACCADTGEWFLNTDTVGSSEIGELNRLRFSRTATTFQSEAGLDGIEGISHPADSYTLTQTRTGRQWSLRFQDQQGHSGVLYITIPASITSYGADLHDGSQGGGGGPLLYKEWRAQGGLRGTGIFSRGITPDARFRLVFQGRGNSCENVEDYKNWLLEVSGRRARYTLYGTFGPAAPQS
ncbi:MAG TPA: hypothetical protein VGO91_18295 [Pyrinomonadaceae bacterium]|nr:hypothetical protein [Pyrinomonadaceae bacterium]